MTTEATTTALILTIFALVGSAIIPTGVVPPTAAYAQLSDVDDIVDDSLESIGITEEEEEVEEDSNIEQKPANREVGQEGIDHSEDFDGTSNNLRTQSGADDQGIAHEIVNSNDFSESYSELGYAEGKYSSFTYSSTGAENKAHEQDADNDGELSQDEEQTVDHDTSIFADDDPANVATSIAMPVYVQVQEQVEEEP